MFVSVRVPMSVPIAMHVCVQGGGITKRPRLAQDQRDSTMDVKCTCATPLQCTKTMGKKAMSNHSKNCRDHLGSDRHTSEDGFKFLVDHQHTKKAYCARKQGKKAFRACRREHGECDATKQVECKPVDHCVCKESDWSMCRCQAT